MTTPNTTPAGAAMRECPFCGGEPLLSDFEQEVYRMRCETCRCYTDWYGAPELAIAAWNCRTASAQHEQLQRLLGEYQDLYLEAQRQRDALAAEVAAVRAEPRYEPVEDGDYLLECGGHITVSGQGLDVADAFEHWAIVDAGDLRLCRRTLAQAIPAPAQESSEVERG